MREHTCGVAVYIDSERELERAANYVSLAASLGFREVFSSLHLPEMDASASLALLRALAQHARSLGMCVSLDASGSALHRLLTQPALLEEMRSIPLDWLRMDFGFSQQDILSAARLLCVPGFMVNASVLDADELEKIVPLLRDTLQVRVRAHHNFYPRPETGLSEEFMTARSLQYKKFGIPVTACVASLREPRVPLKAGLPTVEAHRAMPCGLAARKLLATGVVDSILIGDSFASERELQDVRDACSNAPVRLRLTPSVTLSEQEHRIIYAGVHHVRPDCGPWALRSESSRGMAAPGQKVAPREACVRGRYAVTIDNEKYLRYSGELQLVTAALPADARVNVVGYIDERDQALADCVLPGMDFVFIEDARL